MVKPWSSVRIDSGSCKRGPDIRLRLDNRHLSLKYL